MKIYLAYLSNNTTGGWVTFTSHLIQSLEKMGHEVELLKVGNNTERKPRPFGYEHFYRNVAMIDMIKIVKSGDPFIIVAVAKQLAAEAKDLLKLGARVVVHDPTEVASYMSPEDVTHRSPWVIRKANAERLPGSTFIRHPYVPRELPRTEKFTDRKGIVSVSRIDFDKNTDMILRANRSGAKIKIHGFENRLYTKFKLMPEFPEWKQSVSHYPREQDAAFGLMAKARAMVDLSLIKGDGGGTQYTFLEAWDAGAAVVIHQEWLRRNDDMKMAMNCISVSDSDQLARLCKAVNKGVFIFDMEGITDRARKQMKRNHAPKVIVPQILEWLET